MPMKTESKTIYECTRCGECCRWPGQVRVVIEEIDAMADFLGLDACQFIQAYTTLTPDRRGLTLGDREDGACIFLQGGNVCLINPVKPDQCSGFPNKWNFPGFERICQAKRLDIPSPEGE